MEVLEIKPVKNKKISVYVINSANYNFNIPDLRKLIDYLKDIGVNFITITLEAEELRNFNETSLAKLLENSKIPHFLIDIPEYAKGYLFEEITEKEEQITELLNEYLELEDKDSFKAQNLLSWLDLLIEEVKEKKEFIDLKLRPQWIVKKILDIIKSKKSKEITFTHFTREEIFSEIIKLLGALNFEVIVYNGNNNNSMSFNLITNQEEIEQW